MDYCLVYLSSSVGLFSEKELQNILQQSRKNNGVHDITGMLLYCNGSIMQLLEGDQDHVQVLFNIICQDSRHSNVIKIYHQPLVKHNFTDWSMGFSTVSVKHFDEINNSFAEATLEKTHIALKLFKDFYQTNYRN